MKIFLLTIPVPEQAAYNGGYVPFDDDGFQTERELHIEDDEGRHVVLKNKQIWELYQHIKPKNGCFP